jgi:hypothetical protein
VSPYMSFKADKLLFSAQRLSAELKDLHSISVKWSLHLCKLVCVLVSDIVLDIRVANTLYDDSVLSRKLGMTSRRKM